MAVVLLSLLAAPHQGADAAGRSAALVRLLLGADPQDVAPLLGGAEQWTVVHARRSGGAGPVDPLTAGALGASLGSALVDAGRGRDAVRVLVPGDDRITPQPGWTLGASAPAPITALDLADGQASRSLGRAVATRTPLAHHHSGPGSGLSALIPRTRPRPTPAPSSPRSPSP